MKILIVTNSYPTAKNPTHQIFIRNICEGLQKEGMEVDLVYNPFFDFFKSDLETGNVITSVLKTVFLLVRCLPIILFRARRYDIIYSHAPVWPGFFMLAAQKIHNVRHVTYVHGSVNHYVKRRGFLFKIARYTLKKCTAVVTNSSYMVNRLQKEYHCKSTVIPPGYNDTVFTCKPAERTVDIFFAGSTIRRKGIQLLLETISRYKNFYKQRKLTIRMNFSGGMKSEFIRSSELKGIRDFIKFGDRLVERELAEAYRHSKVFVFPSSEEPLGLVGIEAIACGAVLVGSDSGGIKEYLIDGENGFLFEDGNTDNLQRAIEKALERFPEFEMKQPSVSKSVKDFTLPVAMKQTVSFFRELGKK